MNNVKLLAGISYIEFINNIDNLVNELLYSPNGGYTSLFSKNAVISAQSVVDKFDHEIEKLKKQIDFPDSDKVIEEKRKDLIKQIKKHYDIQSLAWADEVYQNMLDNCFLQATIFKNDKEVRDKIYAKIISGVSWIANVRKLNDETLNKLIKFNLNKFHQALNSNDKDYIPKSDTDKSDVDLFIEFRDQILKNKDKFIIVDFNSLNDKLSVDDINYFNRLKRDLQTYKINTVKDDILLVNSAIDVLKIKNNNEKYNFVKLVVNDFNSQFENLDENKKIDLVKRRMKLFKNSLHNDNISEYFKSKIIS